MRRLLVYIALIVCCCGANAQLLYEISGNGLSKPSFLFGTHHLVSSEVTKDIPGVFRAFNDCSAVVGEFVDNSAYEDPAETELRILSAAKMELSIFDLLSDKEEMLVDSVLQAELGLTLSEMQYFRPNMLTLIYEMTVAERLGKQDNMSIDAYFQVAANELGMAVYGLETIEKQVEMIFRSNSIERQAKRLVESIRNGDAIKKEYEKIETLYKEGNLEKLYELLVEGDDMSEVEKFLLIDERNRDWMPLLEKYIKKEACFVTIGALHLPGEEGLINLLKKAGYKVKAVNK